MDAFNWCKTIDTVYGRFLVAKVEKREIFISFVYNGMPDDSLVVCDDETLRNEYFDEIDDAYCESIYHAKTPSIN